MAILSQSWWSVNDCTPHPYWEPKNVCCNLASLHNSDSAQTIPSLLFILWLTHLNTYILSVKSITRANFWISVFSAKVADEPVVLCSGRTWNKIEHSQCSGSTITLAQHLLGFNTGSGYASSSDTWMRIKKLWNYITLRLSLLHCSFCDWHIWTQGRDHSTPEDHCTIGSFEGSGVHMNLKHFEIFQTFSYHF